MGTFKYNCKFTAKNGYMQAALIENTRNIHDT